MKKYFSVIKRCTCALLAFMFIFCIACGEKKADSYAIYGINDKGKVSDSAFMTEGMFRYYLSQQKSEILPVLVLNYPNASNYDELWDLTAPDGKTYDQHFFENIIAEASRIVAANTALYDMKSVDGSDKRYELPQEYLDYVDSTIETFAIDNYGSVMNFENYLATFGATYDDYTKLYIMTLNVDLLEEALFNDQSGALRISDAEKKEYYVNNYYTVEHIFINTTYIEKIDGTRAPLTENETQKRSALASEIHASVLDGKTLADIGKLYPQDYVTVYPEPAAMDSNGETTNAPELGAALKTLEIGEVATVNSAYGVHVIKRIETLPERFDPSSSAAESIRSKLVSKYFEEYLTTYGEKVTVNDDVVGLWSLKSAPMP